MGCLVLYFANGVGWIHACIMHLTCGLSQFEIAETQVVFHPCVHAFKLQCITVLAANQQTCQSQAATSLSLAVLVMLHFFLISRLSDSCLGMLVTEMSACLLVLFNCLFFALFRWHFSVQQGCTEYYRLMALFDLLLQSATGRRVCITCATGF